MNRAPGPNDFWWNQHKIECNGTFIKISEPEKKNKKTTETRAIKSVVKSKDIRDFFKHSGEVDFDTSNITTLTDLNLSLKVTKSEFKSLSVIKKNKAKIFNLKKSSSSEKKSDQQGKALSKGKGKIQGKTLLKSQEKCLIPVAQLNFDKDKSLSNGTFCKSINATTNAKSGSVENVQEVVRNVWSKKFLSVVDDISPDTKKMKIDCCEKQFSEKKEKSNYSCEAVEEIIDCTEKPKMCPVCNELIIVELKDHLESCVPPAFRSQNDDEKSRNKYDYDFLPCPCCYKCFHESEMNSHIDECLTMIALKEEMLSF